MNYWIFTYILKPASVWKNRDYILSFIAPIQSHLDWISIRSGLVVKFTLSPWSMKKSEKYRLDWTRSIQQSLQISTENITIFWIFSAQMRWLYHLWYFNSLVTPSWTMYAKSRKRKHFFLKIIVFSRIKISKIMYPFLDCEISNLTQY